MPNIATDATQTQYDALYLKSQPPAVQKLMALPGGIAGSQARVTLGRQLAGEGYLIDTTIMIWAWSAYWTMKSRLAYGYTWVPSALQPPVQIAPTVKEPGIPTYDGAIVPPGALIVTLDMDLLPIIFAASKPV